LYPGIHESVLPAHAGDWPSLLQVHANRAHGMTRGRNGRLYLLADQRGNETFPRPVLLEVLGVG